MNASPAPPFEDVLSAGGESVRALMDEVDVQLVEVASAYGGELERAAGSTLAAGGKRLRPLLVFICGEGAGSSRRSALTRAGAAVELVHMASLVHDDVLDRAQRRRGRPTVYAATGRAAATATGDFLFSRAFSLLAGSDDEEQIRALSEACLALARGELAQREDAYARALSVERYLYRCELKTASLFAAACKLGSLAAGHGDSPTDALARFGHKLGLAFQVVDDMLDVAGDVDDTGKQRGSDLLDGTVTLPLIVAARSDSVLANLDLRSVNSREDAERICDRIAATDALDEARGRARELVLAAKLELGNEIGPRLVDLLNLVADRVLDRRT
jgi:geranylgeranyl pyrophosphate synthase